MRRNKCQRSTVYSQKFICFIVAIVLMASCGKMDKNGDLGGNWQMVEWRDNATQEVKATNQALLFYTVHLNVIQFQDRRSGAYPHQATFSHIGDSLILGKVVYVRSNSDSLCTVNDLARYGADSSGKFLIESLSSENMILRNSKNTLKFRKY